MRPLLLAACVLGASPLVLAIEPVSTVNARRVSAMHATTPSTRFDDILAATGNLESRRVE